MTKRYSIIGDIVADLHNEHIRPGGSAAIALAINALGGTVTLRSVLGTDHAGKDVLAQLKKARIHPGLIGEASDSTTAVVEWDDEGGIINRVPGIGIKKGAVMDVYDLFGHDAVVIDIQDQPLRRMLSDLPSHTDGRVRMIGTLRHLDWLEPTNDEMEVAMRFDAIVGTDIQYGKLTGRTTPADALGDIYDRMPGTHLRAAVAVTCHGVEMLGREERVLRPVRSALPDIQLPGVVAAIAWGLAHREKWDVITSVAADPLQVRS